jgi:signal-transduction protein with cAMP-binding, CBS, and nucleotidyltransferase domain
MPTVQDIINNKPTMFNTIAPDTKVIDALQSLSAVNLSYLVVMDGEEYKGIFCERDYSRNVILKGRSSNSTKVDEVMTTDLAIVQVSDTVNHCMNLMNAHRGRYLLAYNDIHFVGVITIHDLLRQVIASNKEDEFNSKLANALITNDEEGGSRIY